MSDTVRRLEVVRVAAEGRPRRAAAWAPAIVLGLLTTALLLWMVLGMGAEGRALRHLPRDERAELVAGAVKELRRACPEGRPAALDGHCRDLASFAAQFAECRGECAELVRRELAPRPTR